MEGENVCVVACPAFGAVSSLAQRLEPGLKIVVEGWRGGGSPRGVLIDPPTSASVKLVFEVFRQPLGGRRASGKIAKRWVPLDDDALIGSAVTDIYARLLDIPVIPPQFRFPAVDRRLEVLRGSLQLHICLSLLDPNSSLSPAPPPDL